MGRDFPQRSPVLQEIIHKIYKSDYMSSTNLHSNNFPPLTPTLSPNSVIHDVELLAWLPHLTYFLCF